MVISSNKFENFELFCPLGAMKLRVQQKKSLHLIQGLRVRVEMGTKSEKVCMCVCVCDAFLLASISPYISKVRSHFWLKFGRVLSIYEALMLLNFCGNRGRGLVARTKLLKVSNWKKLLGSKVLGIYLKLSLAIKFILKPIPVPKKSKKMTKYSFFANFSLVMSS